MGRKNAEVQRVEDCVEKTMTFASLGYLTFLLLLLPAYRLTPIKQRWILFLAASYYFYGCWNIKYSLLMLASTVFSY